MRRLSVTLLVFALVLCSFSCDLDNTKADAPLATSIGGTVVNETGVGMSGVQIKAVNVTSSWITFTGSSNEVGNYSFTVYPGIYNVTATYLNYSANISYVSVLVDTGDEVQLNFTMSEVLCLLTGYVTNGTAPVPGATVTLHNSDNTYTTVTVTPLGKYTIYAKPGTYTLKVEKVGYWTNYSENPVTLVRFVDQQIDINMTEQPATLRGRVVYQGDGVSGVSVSLSSAQYNVSTVTDENGNYSFENVPVGTYTLLFSKDTYLDVTQSVTLSVYEDEVRNVELEYDSENNTQKFLFGFDLAHSLMVVGLVVSLIVLIVTLFITFKVRRKPEILKEEKDSD